MVMLRICLLITLSAGLCDCCCLVESMMYPTGINICEATKIDSCNTLDFVILGPKVWCCKNYKYTHICDLSVY